MNNAWDVVILSTEIESTRTLKETLSRNGMDALWSYSISDCRQLLAERNIGLVFCDRFMMDGSYRDLLNVTRMLPRKVRVVVVSRSFDWDEYLADLRFGAFDVISSPCRPTDVEWTVSRVSRAEREASETERLPQLQVH